MPRLFYALWPDAETRQQIAGIAERVKIRRGRRIPPANLHITLAFLGNVDDAALANALAVGGELEGNGFQLTLERCGWYARSRVAWLAPLEAPAALLTLVADLRHALAEARLPVEPRAYAPHLTIARDVPARPLLGEPFQVHWPVKDFALIESVTGDGPARYRPLHAWSLTVQ
jgi:2'-5' RNA ligase